MSDFVHLHTHSDHSQLDGLSQVDQLVKRVAELGMSAVALTDHGTMSGTVPLVVAASKAGIKPIVGCETYVAPRGMRDKEKEDRDAFHLVLLAQNDVGYKNLCSLVTTSHLEGFYYKPRIDHALLRDHSDGLICLSGCEGSEVPQAVLSGDFARAEGLVRTYQEIFGDRYFLEIQDHGRPKDVDIRSSILDLSRKTGVPVVATGDSHYVEPGDHLAHDVLLCLQTGTRLDDPKRLRFEGDGYHVASGDEMRKVFGNEPVDNTLAVAELCSFSPNFNQVLLPQAPLADGADPRQVLAAKATDGLERRFGSAPPPEAYRARLAQELDVINRTGFAPYFLIVSDFTDEAQKRSVAVGPGRGSAAGSLVSYSLGITNVDPVRYGLVFERFLNEERLSMPDIDLDFEPNGRDQLINYARKRYGEAHVAQIATFGTMGSRGAIRDVGRVLNIPLAEVDAIAKAIPEGLPLAAMVLDDEFRALVRRSDRGQELLDLSSKLEGTKRNIGKHASGVVISPVPIQDLMPLQESAGSNRTVITQFDLSAVLEMGLLKVDFLGLDNLTLIKDTLRMVKAQEGVDLDVDAIPLDDPATFSLLARGDTVGVFQFEQSGGKGILREMRPRTLEDIAAANAINRPGPLTGRVEGGLTIKDTYMARRKGEQPVTFPTPECEPYLKDTEGLMLYQDQVMQVAAVVAGYSLGEADVLRAAMGKKDPEKMAHQRERFVRGAIERGTTEEDATELFNAIATFAGYGFNKAHAVSYALVGYQTAYLKAHHPVEFTAALMNCRSGDLDKINVLVRDAQSHGITVQPPSVQESAANFSVAEISERGGKIRFGLSAIKKVGVAAAAGIVAARAEGGEFTSLTDLVKRTPAGSCTMRDLEGLVLSGACDSIGERNALLAALPVVRRDVERMATAGPGLFGDDPGSTLGLPDAEPMPVAERLQAERELCGSYLSGHPAIQAGSKLWGLTTVACADAGRVRGMQGRVGGVVIEAVHKRSQAGNDVLFATIEDQTGVCKVLVMPQTYGEAAAALQPGALVVASGRIEDDMGRGNEAGEEEGTERLATCIAEQVLSIDDPRTAEFLANGVVHIRCPSDPERLSQLRELVAQNPGSLPVVIHPEGDGEAIRMPARNRIRDDEGVRRAIQGLCGPGAWRWEERTSRDNGPKELSDRTSRVTMSPMRRLTGGPTCPAR